MSSTATTSMATASANPGCPVCADAARDAATCARCGWVLAGGPWVGELTEARLRAHDVELTAARTRFDVGVAVAAAQGDPDVAARVARFARGQAAPSDLADALRAWSPPATESLAEVVGAAIARLAADPHAETSTLAVVEVGVEGVVQAVVAVNAAGVLSLARRATATPWHKIAPWLPLDQDERRFTLAGKPDALRGLAGVATAGERAIVLNAVPGWRGVDDLVDARRRTHPVDGPGLTDELLTRLLADAPLRLDHCLVLVETTDGGRTRAVRAPLFAAGSVASATDDVEVVVQGAAGRAESVLAVVAGAPGVRAQRCAPVLVVRCALPEQGLSTLRFRLHGPGAVELIAPQGVSRDPESTQTWPAVLDAIPEVHDRDPGALDLVLAVERSGTPEGFAARRAFLLALLDALADAHPAPAAVRVAVLAYRDHYRAERGDVVDGTGFTSVERAAAAVAELTATEVFDERVAPVEDALRAAGSLPWAAAERRFLLVGARLPHPVAEVSDIWRCANDLNWERAAADLRGLGVTRFAVWDRPERLARHNRESLSAEQVWRDLGRGHGDPALGGTDPAAVLRTAGLLRGARPPEPLLVPLVPARPDLESST